MTSTTRPAAEKNTPHNPTSPATQTSKLTLGASLLMVLMTVLVCVALLRAQNPLPNVQEAGALEIGTPGRLWSPLRTLQGPTRSPDAVNAAMRALLPKGSGDIDAQQFMTQFEARWFEVLSMAPKNSSRALRNVLSSLYQQAGRFPKFIAVLRQAQVFSNLMHSAALVLGKVPGDVIREKMGAVDQMMPWLAYATSELGDSNEALPMIREIVRRQPHNPEALFFYAIIAIQQPEQTPEALLTFRNLIESTLRLEPNFSMMDIRPDQLRGEIQQANAMLRDAPPQPTARRVASDQIQAALKRGLDHIDTYITPAQRVAFAGRTVWWWLSLLSRASTPTFVYLKAIWLAAPTSVLEIPLEIPPEPAPQPPTP